MIRFRFMTMLLTTLALIAFAANSLLCRLALSDGLIDPVTFSAIRLAAGMLVLLPLSGIVREPAPSKSWKNAAFSGLALFTYALTFSLSYVSVGSGTGTLMQVGAVQISMLGYALFKREPISMKKWLGITVSAGGLIYLVSPGLTAPDPKGAVLMICAGIAWGIYSVRGRGATAPVLMSARNFTCASAAIVLIAITRLHTLEISARGASLAVISGAITSGLAYVIWYRVLRTLSTTTASMIQLTVPILAAFGGIAFLNEELSFRLILSTALILGGVIYSLQKSSETNNS